VKLTENNIAAIWVYRRPEVEIKVSAGGVTLRIPVKLRVTGAGQARDLNAVASGRLGYARPRRVRLS
jgi:hypothetical protein